MGTLAQTQRLLHFIIYCFLYLLWYLACKPLGLDRCTHYILDNLCIPQYHLMVCSTCHHDTISPGFIHDGSLSIHPVPTSFLLFYHLFMFPHPLLYDATLPLFILFGSATSLAMLLFVEIKEEPAESVASCGPSPTNRRLSFGHVL